MISLAALALAVFLGGCASVQPLLCSHGFLYAKNLQTGFYEPIYRLRSTNQVEQETCEE